MLETLKGGRKISAVYLSSSRREKLAAVEEALARRGVQAKKVDESFFEERFVKGHQGIAARVVSREYAQLEDLLRIPHLKRQTPLFLILDGIEDPRNFGSILRVADAGGVHGVVIQAHRSALLTAEAVKASAGASEYVQISVVPNIKHAMRAMRDVGVVVLGAEAAGDVSVWKTDLTGPIALVIGSEAEGMRRTVREQCDRIVSLPMQGRVNSLNVSVAAGVIIFEIIRQRTRIS